MLTFRHSLIAALTLGATLISAEALVLHVSPHGDDANVGSERSPLFTVRAALAKLRASGEAERIVKLAPGTYPFTGPLKISADDSGKPGRPLQVMGSGAGVVLSGFKPLSPEGWTMVSDRADRDRLSESVRDRVRQYRFGGSERVRLGRLSRRGFDAEERRESNPAMLHLGGRRMTIARWPNDGTVVASKTLEAGPTRYVESDADWLRFWEGGGRFEIASDRASNWSQPDKVWVNGRLGNAWEWSVNQVKSISGREIELAYGEVSGVGCDEAHPPEMFFENVLEELDRPGEYYMDSERGLLYFLPPTGDLDWQRDAKISWCEEPLLQLEDARHVLLSNLRVEGGRGEGISMKGVLDVTIEDVQVRHCAGDGVVVDGREVRVKGLLAEELGGRGILLRGGDKKTLRTSGHTVTASRFVGTGWWDRAWRPAMALIGVGHQVRDCEFAELPHMAIEVKGNDFKIEGCWFNNTCTEFRDMCAIYFNLGSDPQQRGTVIGGNLFQNIGLGRGGARGGIYLDNGTNGVTVADNVFHRVGDGEDGWAVMVHGGSHVRVDRNIFIDCPVPLHVGYWWATYGKGELAGKRKRWQELLTGEATATHRKRYPELKGFLSEDHVLPTTNTFRGNRMFNSRQPLLAEGGVSVFGGPRSVLSEAENVSESRLGGLSFDSRGRPVIPGARPWRSAEVSAR